MLFSDYQEIDLRFRIGSPTPVKRTKWEILNARAVELRAALADVEQEMRGLENTRCGLSCSGCGMVLETEKDFAEHFTIPDERYLNLGNCPTTPRR